MVPLEPETLHYCTVNLVLNSSVESIEFLSSIVLCKIPAAGHFESIAPFRPTLHFGGQWTAPLKLDEIG